VTPARAVSGSLPIIMLGLSWPGITGGNVAIQWRISGCAACWNWNAQEQHYVGASRDCMAGRDENELDPYKCSRYRRDNVLKHRWKTYGH